MYMRGINVRIVVTSFEMSTFFLSAAKDLTLLESDGDLLGLIGGTMNQLVKEELMQLNAEQYYWLILELWQQQSNERLF